MSHQVSRSRPGPGTLFLIWLVAILLMVGDGEATPTSATATATATVTGGGSLELLAGAAVRTLPAVATTVDVTVTGPLVATVVRQEFTNPTTEVVGARYVFPLPEGAAVAAMEMLIGERRIVSVVQEKAAARATFAAAQREGRKAALVEGLRPNLFTTEVANIGPGERVVVRLEYLAQADFSAGWFSLVVPLTFTPRYVPPVAPEVAAATGTGSAPAADPPILPDTPFVRPGEPGFPRVDIDVRLNPGLELSDLVSPSHTLTMVRDGETWLVGPDRRHVPADRDFILRWQPVSAPLARPALFVEDRPDARYALLMVVPGTGDASTPRPPTDTVFVLDVSGSMGGPSLDQARTALQEAIGHLRADDRFSVLAFDDRTTVWSDELRAVTPVTRVAARAWVGARAAGGGTQMHPALLQARLLLGGPGPEGRARRLILLTDAAVGNEDQLLRESIAGLGDVRLHVVGIGAAPNRYLVRRLAGEGGGLSLFVSGHGDDGQRLAAFLTRVARPQWSNPRLAWRGSPSVEGYPARLPAPVSDDLTLWSGRFPVGTDLEGFLRAGGAAGPLDIPLGAADPVTGAGIATRWARLKVGDLLAAHDSGGDRAALRDEVIATAIEHGLVTRFTSRVAVEQRPSVATPQGETRAVPSGLPLGSQLMGVLPSGGTLDPLWRMLGIVLLLTGAAALKAGRRGWSR